MGRTGRSAAAGRFVPRGDDGGSIDASLVMYCMLEWMSDRRRGWEISCCRSDLRAFLHCMYLTPPPLPMNHLSHKIDKIEARANNRPMCI